MLYFFKKVFFLNVPNTTFSTYYFRFLKMLQTCIDTIFSGFEFPPKMVLRKPVMSLEVSLRWPAIRIKLFFHNWSLAYFYLIFCKIKNKQTVKKKKRKSHILTDSFFLFPKKRRLKSKRQYFAPPYTLFFFTFFFFSLRLVWSLIHLSRKHAIHFRQSKIRAQFMASSE